MPAELAFLIVAVAVIAITYKTYVGYGDYRWYTKLGFFLFLLIGWSAPFLGFILRRADLPESWMVIDLVRRAPVEEMKNPPLLQKVNIITFVFCLLFCFYGVYEAEKNPAIKTYDITSPKVRQKTKVVMLSDLHIDVDVSPETVERLVNRVNTLNPDAVVIVGDIVDNTPVKLYKQMQELKKLKVKDHVYLVLGNHEFYSGAMGWGLAFAQMGFEFLNNYGEKLGDTGIYIAGIPDINAAEWFKKPVKAKNALYKAEKEDYVIILSHTPKLAEGVTAENVDLQLSGHTHGGQIYPFHYFTEIANDGVLAGFYNKNGVQMYVSRGTRYWGPPMRIFAPSEITVFNFSPAGKNGKPAA
mgnify:CR=1 FL=1